MSAENLRDMALDLKQVQMTVRFLEAYANTSLAELRLLLEDESSGVNARDTGQRLTREPALTIAADAATSLRGAGQWLLYVDPAGAADLLSRSGRLFRDLGQPFGLYLLAVIGELDHEAPPYGMVAEMLQAVVGDSSRAAGEQASWPALKHPQQQAYLLLAAAGSRLLNDEFRHILSGAIKDSLHRRGVLPVGALGTPIRSLWEVARHLSAEFPESVQVIAQHLVGMCRRYAETMRLAQVNEYLWNHGAAPVDVGDVDIAGISALTARRYGEGSLIEALEAAGLRFGEDRIALAPVEAGLTLAQSGGWTKQGG